MRGLAARMQHAGVDEAASAFAAAGYNAATLGGRSACPCHVPSPQVGINLLVGAMGDSVALNTKALKRVLLLSSFDQEVGARVGHGGGLGVLRCCHASLCWVLSLLSILPAVWATCARP